MIKRITVLVLYLVLWPIMAYAEGVPEVVLQTIAMEGANQSVEGQMLIASTILNRARIRHTTPEVEAIRPFQYSCWNDRRWAKTWLSRHYDRQTRLSALSAYHEAINAKEGYPVLTHYHTISIKPYWAKGRKPDVVIGQHAFYSGID